MDSPMSDLGFRGMSILFKVRDLVVPRRAVLEEVGIKPGDCVLDYGCGPGGYLVETARLVGETGMIYALDVHPLAVARVEELARSRGITNVQTICSDCKTGLPDDSVDVVLLYDIFHMLSEPEAVLGELYRVLKPDGVLSCSGHHIREQKLVAGVTAGHLFALGWKEAKTYGFVPRKAQEAAGGGARPLVYLQRSW